MVEVLSPSHKPEDERSAMGETSQSASFEEGSSAFERLLLLSDLARDTKLLRAISSERSSS